MLHKHFTHFLRRWSTLGWLRHTGLHFQDGRCSWPKQKQKRLQTHKQTFTYLYSHTHKNVLLFGSTGCMIVNITVLASKKKGKMKYWNISVLPTVAGFNSKYWCKMGKKKKKPALFIITPWQELFTSCVNSFLYSAWLSPGVYITWPWLFYHLAFSAWSIFWHKHWQNSASYSYIRKRVPITKQCKLQPLSFMDYNW